MAVCPINTFWHISSGMREQWLVASIPPPNNKQKNKWNFGLWGESQMSGESDLSPAPLRRHLLSLLSLHFLFHLFLPSRIQFFQSFTQRSTWLQLLHFKWQIEELNLCSVTIIIRIHMLSSQTMKSSYYAPLMPIYIFFCYWFFCLQFGVISGNKTFFKYSRRTQISVFLCRLRVSITAGSKWTHLRIC